MKRKIIIIIMILIIVLGLGFYIFSTNNIFKNAIQIIHSTNQKTILCISNKEPIMAFGSGHKVMRLYTCFYFFIGKCTFGEHPLEIEKWENNNIYVLIRTPYKDDANIEYIINWVEKNKRIGDNYLHYKIITPIKEIVL